MPDTELMDEVLAIITEIPALHDQEALAVTLPDTDRRDAEEELNHAAAEVGGLVPDCDSAHCFAGWVLVLRGYRFDTTAHRWVGPDGVRLVSPSLLHLAAGELDIPYAEAYDSEQKSGIFWDGSTLEDIHLWVAFYKGEVDRDDLEYRLERADA